MPARSWGRLALRARRRWRGRSARPAPAASPISASRYALGAQRCAPRGRSAHGAARLCAGPPRAAQPLAAIDTSRYALGADGAGRHHSLWTRLWYTPPAAVKKPKEDFYGSYLLVVVIIGCAVCVRVSPNQIAAGRSVGPCRLDHAAPAPPERVGRSGGPTPKLSSTRCARRSVGRPGRVGNAAGRSRGSVGR